MSDVNAAATAAAAAATAAASSASTAANAAGASSAAGAPEAGTEHGDTLVQYIVMRSDLVKSHKWNIGGLISNGSHACVSVLSSNWNDAHVQSYVSPAAATQMHKVCLSARDEAELDSTAAMLTQHKVTHTVWREQPENLRSCLATKPYPRHFIQPLLRHLKLFR